MSLETFYILAAKVLCKEASPSEIAEFHQLIAENQEWKEMVHNMEELWHSTPATPTHYFSSTEEAYLIHLGRLKDTVNDFDQDVTELAGTENEDFQLYPVSKPWYKKWQLYAAVAVFFLVATFSFRYLSESNAVFAGNQKPLNEINVRAGAKTKLQLPDGSRVWVNSDSKLTYAETFKGPTREVFLEGEAYFDVVKDPSHPFIVHTSGIDVRVLGTAFNVKAYKTEPTIEATLVHGLIEVTKTNQPNASKVILKPHEKLIFNKFAQEEQPLKPLSAESIGTKDHLAKPAITITPIAKGIPDSAFIETAWIYNRLSFDEERFDDLAVKMERWFNVNIRIGNEKIKSYKLTGSFEEETIEEALKELQYLVSFSFQKNGKEIIINKK